MRIESVEQLLQEELRDIYDAEKQLVKALPKMAKAASSGELREAFTEHLEVTKEHVRRCERIFASLGLKAKSKPCAGMKGIVKEGRQVMEEDGSESLLDTALAGAGRRVEHYEISAYDTARGLAQQLGNGEVIDLLQQTLDEEQETDRKLSSITQDLLANMPEDIDSDPEMAGKSGRGGNRGSSRTSRRRTSQKRGSKRR